MLYEKDTNSTNPPTPLAKRCNGLEVALLSVVVVFFPLFCWIF